MPSSGNHNQPKPSPPPTPPCDASIPHAAAPDVRRRHRNPAASPEQKAVRPPKKVKPLPTDVISPCQGRHGKYLKNYSRKFHVGVLVSAWDLRHFVMPRILLCISESVCSRQSGTVPGSSRAELPCELPLASLLQIVPENVRNCKNGRIGRWPNAARRRY